MTSMAMKTLSLGDKNVGKEKHNHHLKVYRYFFKKIFEGNLILHVFSSFPKSKWGPFCIVCSDHPLLRVLCGQTVFRNGACTGFRKLLLAKMQTAWKLYQPWFAIVGLGAVFDICFVNLPQLWYKKKVYASQHN